MTLLAHVRVQGPILGLLKIRLLAPILIMATLLGPALKY